MTRLKKIGIALVLIVAVLSIGVIAAFGADVVFTGRVEYLTTLVNNLEKAQADVMEGGGDLSLIEKNLITIDNYLYATPVDPEAEGYADLENRITAVKKALVDEAIRRAGTVDSAVDKAYNISYATEWFYTIPFTDAELTGEYYIGTLDKMESTIVSVANALYNDIDLTKLDATDKESEKDIANEGVEIKRLRTFVDENEIRDDSSYRIAFVEVYEKAVEAMNVYQIKKDERYNALVAAAPLTEYGFGNALYLHFENGQDIPNISSQTDGGRSTFVGTENQTYTDAYGSTVKNAYLTLRWPKEADTGLKTYITPQYATGTSLGAIIEFDITTYGNFVNDDLKFGNRRADDDRLTLGGEQTAMLYIIKANGDLVVKPSDARTATGSIDWDAQEIVFQNTITPGQWTRLSAVINPKTPDKTDLYIDYCYICTFDSMLNGSNPTNLRIGNNKNIVSGEFSIDNFTVQIGTWFRDEEYINKMTDGRDKLEYYADYMRNEAYGIRDRMAAYESIQTVLDGYATLDTGTGDYTVLGEYASEKRITDVIEIFNAFDSVQMVNKFKAENTVRIAEMQKEYEALGRTLDNISDRKIKIEEMSSFITLNEVYFESGETYNNAVSCLHQAKVDLETDNNILAFNEAMSSFNAAVSAHLLQVKYDAATALLAKTDTSLVNANGYTTFKSAYNNYQKAAAKIKDAVEKNNSRDIVNYMTYLAENYPDQSDWKILPIVGDKLNADEIAHNNKFAFLEEYMNKVRSLVNAGYKADYAGIDAAIYNYDIMNEHYYDYLQRQHADYIVGILDEFAATDSYIVKKGLVVFLDKYIVEKDVDKKHSSIVPLIVRFNAYKEELAFQEGKTEEGNVDTYSEILRQNTVSFVNCVQLYDTMVTYEDKLALYEEATGYYYIMNATGVGVEEATVIYNRMAADLAVIQLASESFKNALSLRKLTPNADMKYTYLVEAMENYAYIDTSIEGMSAAIAEYERVLAEYNESITEANGELCEISDALGSHRANCGISDIISVILDKIFNFAR